MPQAANLIVNDGLATPVARTFELLYPSAGENAVAEWAYKKGTTSSGFPRLTTLSRRNATKTGRVAQIKLKVPFTYTDSTTGLTSALPGFEFNGSVTVLDQFPESAKDDAVAFTVNVLQQAVFKAFLRDAMPMT